MVQSITLQTSDPIIVSGDNIGRLAFAASSEASAGDSIKVAGIISVVAEAEFTAAANAASMVFSTSATDTASGQYKITSVGDFLPMNGGQDLGSTTNVFTSLYVDNIQSISEGIVLSDNTPSVTTNALYNVGGSLYFNGSTVTPTGTASGVAFFGDDNSLTASSNFVFDNANTGIYLYRSATDRLEIRPDSVGSYSNVYNIYAGFGTDREVMIQPANRLLICSLDNASRGRIRLGNQSSYYGGITQTSFGNLTLTAFRDNGLTSLNLIGGTAAGSTYGIQSQTFHRMQKDLRVDGQGDFNSGIVVTSAVSTDIPLLVQGAASQSANLQEWQDSAGTVLADVNPQGTISGSGFTFPDGITQTVAYTGDSDTTYTAGSGLTLDGTEFNIYGGTGQFKQVLFESDLVQIGSSTTANGAESISIGGGAGNNSNGSTNLIAIGGNAGNNATNANLVVSIGDDSCSSSQSLAFTNAIGYFAGASASGTSNNYMGILAGSTNKGDNNVGIGNHALDDSDGSGNIEIVAYGLFEVTPTILGDNSNKIHIGRTLIGDTSSRLYAIGNVGASNLTPDATLEILPAASTDVGLIVQGAASQSANLQEWQDSAGTVLASVDNTGNISGSNNLSADGTLTLLANSAIHRVGNGAKIRGNSSVQWVQWATYGGIDFQSSQYNSPSTDNSQQIQNRFSANGTETKRFHSNGGMRLLDIGNETYQGTLGLQFTSGTMNSFFNPNAIIRTSGTNTLFMYAEDGVKIMNLGDVGVSNSGYTGIGTEYRDLTARTGIFTSGVQFPDGVTQTVAYTGQVAPTGMVSWNLSVSGASDSITDSATVTFTGLGLSTVTYDEATNTVYISGSGGGGSTYTAASGITLEGSTFTMSGTGTLSKLNFDSESVFINNLNNTNIARSVLIGYEAGGASSNTDSVIIGHQAATGSTSNDQSVIIGELAGQNASSNSLSTMIGWGAGDSAVNNDESVNIGFFAGGGASSSYNLIAIGTQAGWQTDQLDYGVNIGYQAGYQMGGTTNQYGNMIGYQAGYQSSGSYNNYIGYRAGRLAGNGTRNIEIVTQGATTSVIGANSNKLHIENTIIGDTSSKLLAIGNVTSANLTPDATLEVLPAASTDVGLIVQGAASQTANLQEWQNSSANILAYVDTDGMISGSGITYTDGTISTSIFTDVVTDGNTGITYSETTFGGKYVRLTNSLDIEVSIPSGLNTYQYTETLFEQAAAGQITVTGQAGVTLNFRSSNTSAGQYAVITLKKIATDTYILFGDLT